VYDAKVIFSVVFVFKHKRPMEKQGDETIKFKLLRDGAILPTRADPGAAGLDLYVWMPDEFSIMGIVLLPKHRKIFKTGLSVCIPTGYYGRIAPRSGLAFKNGVDVMAGVIDSSYRGEIGVILVNHGDKPVVFYKSTRIAQLVIEKIHMGCAEFVSEFGDQEKTERGSGGFGSTGQ